jgi:hypothetical protein
MACKYPRLHRMDARRSCRQARAQGRVRRGAIHQRRFAGKPNEPRLGRFFSTPSANKLNNEEFLRNGRLCLTQASIYENAFSE